MAGRSFVLLDNNVSGVTSTTDGHAGHGSVDITVTRAVGQEIFNLVAIVSTM